MKAWVIHKIVSLKENTAPPEKREIPMPEPWLGELLIRVFVCGVCHTEFDEIEGRTPPALLPMIPLYQVAGTVAGTGQGSSFDGKRNLKRC
jgi:propanol-preferring alcohol dehydrogenase